jgi:hypothetical protein
MVRDIPDGTWPMRCTAAALRLNDGLTLAHKASAVWRCRYSRARYFVSRVTTNAISVLGRRFWGDHGARREIIRSYSVGLVRAASWRAGGWDADAALLIWTSHSESRALQDRRRNRSSRPRSQLASSRRAPITLSGQKSGPALPPGDSPAAEVCRD